jgi:multidrug efflux pump subunit AcrB
MNQFNASAWALEHKSFVGFLMVLLSLAGLLSFDHLGRDEDPPFTIKVMVVRAVWPGATAEDTAREVTDRLEKSLQSLEWIDYISSYTKPGEATLMVKLKDQTRSSMPSRAMGSLTGNCAIAWNRSARSYCGFHMSAR